MYVTKPPLPLAVPNPLLAPVIQQPQPVVLLGLTQARLELAQLLAFRFTQNIQQRP
ncbi:MAG: hypothetical protein ACK544_12490 [Microcystis sp.]